MNTAALETNLSRRQVMIGALGLSFAFVTSRVEAAVTATSMTGKSLSPWVSIAPDGSISMEACRFQPARPRWGRAR